MGSRRIVFSAKNKIFPCFLSEEQNQGNGEKDEPGRHRKRMGRKDAVAVGMIDNEELKAELEGYADKDEPIRKEPQTQCGIS